MSKGAAHQDSFRVREGSVIDARAVLVEGLLAMVSAIIVLVNEQAES